MTQANKLHRIQAKELHTTQAEAKPMRRAKGRTTEHAKSKLVLIKQLNELKFLVFWKQDIF